MLEYIPEDPIGGLLTGKRMVLREVVETLEAAAEDDRVAGLVARVGSAPMGMARIQELRDAVLAFRTSGKPAIAYAETFGEFSPGNGSYYLATAFDRIYLQPSGDIGLTGFIAESPFLRGTLEKVGIEPRMDHRYEYKNAMNTFTERGYTPAHRESMQSLIDGWFGQMVRGIAQARGKTEPQVRELVNRGPFLGKEALDAGLVDGLKYRDEVLQEARKQAGKGAELLYLSKYAPRADGPYDKGKTIALVYGVGAVARGESAFDPVFGEASMGSDTVAGALRAAIDDEDVVAILFRVDSPGGSYVASDTIWRETKRAREAGKPIIVSMGDLAGSGGYFVAMDASKIVAQPGTITGSIGVLAGKMLTSGLWDKVGMGWDEVHTSEHATMWTGTHDYSPEEWARFQTWLDRIYGDFTTKVAQGRKLPLETVLRIARGRIWTGEDAKRLGLVDELGGFPVAIRLAREAAGLKPGAPVRLKQYPPRKSPLQALLAEGPESSDEQAHSAFVRILQVVQPIARGLRSAGLGPDPGALTMPEPAPSP